MNKLFLMLFGLIPIFGYSKPIEATLIEALKANQIQLTATGNTIDQNPSKSNHYGKCLKLKLKNVTSHSIHITIEKAYHLTSIEVRLQDLITSETMIVTLSPNQTKDVLINAFCGEKSNASPDEKDTFKLSYKHSGSIAKLTEMLEKNQLFGNTGQQAIWCFTDNNPLDQIYDTYAQIALEDKLVAFIAAEKNIPVPKRTESYTKRQLRYPIELDGSYSQYIDRPTAIGFYITDSSNKIITTIIEDDTETRTGTAKYSYIYRGQFVTGKYYFKMKLNNEWKTVKEITVGEIQSAE